MTVLLEKEGDFLPFSCRRGENCAKYWEKGARTSDDIICCMLSGVSCVCFARDLLSEIVVAGGGGGVGKTVSSCVFSGVQ